MLNFEALPETVKGAWLIASSRTTSDARKFLGQSVTETIVAIDQAASSLKLGLIGRLLYGTSLLISYQSEELSNETRTVLNVITSRFASMRISQDDHDRRKRIRRSDNNIFEDTNFDAFDIDTSLPILPSSDEFEIPELLPSESETTRLDGLNPAMASVTQPLDCEPHVFDPQDDQLILDDPNMTSLFEDISNANIDYPDDEPAAISQDLESDQLPSSPGTNTNNNLLTPESTPRKPRRVYKPRKDRLLEISESQVIQNFENYRESNLVTRTRKFRRIHLWFGISGKHDPAESQDVNSEGGPEVNVHSDTSQVTSHDTVGGSTPMLIESPAHFELPEIADASLSPEHSLYGSLDLEIDDVMRSDTLPRPRDSLAPNFLMEDLEELESSFHLSVETAVLRSIRESNNPTTLGELWSKHPNDTFAKAEDFYGILSLSTSGKINVDQAQPFEDITITLMV